MNAQLEITLNDTGLERPTMGLHGLKVKLGLEKHQVVKLLEDGSLGWVINIASPGANRRCYRFVSVMVEEFKKQKFVPERTAAEVAVMIWGQPQRYVRGVWFYSRLSTESSQFHDLHSERALPFVKGSKPALGPGGSAMLEWSTLVDFLEKRRV